MLAPITYLPYRMPGTDDFAEIFDEGLKLGSRTFVLRNHGVTVGGSSIEEAYAKLETLEFLAQITSFPVPNPVTSKSLPKMWRSSLKKNKRI